MSRFQIFGQDDIAKLREGGKILRECLEEAARLVQPGVETIELDQFVAKYIRERGGLPAFKGYQGYPASLCVSVNEECVHGIPGNRKIEDGDLVSLDCGVIFGDLYTDACTTVVVGDASAEKRRLAEVTLLALNNACALVAPGTKVGDISACIQKTVEREGFHCMDGLTGHGLGTHLHQFPDIPNSGKAGTGPTIPAYTLLAIEPITSIGTSEIHGLEDGWTICSKDSSPSAHFEHTILVLPEGGEVIA